MRRIIYTFALIGLTTSLGCKATTGTCDCGQSPGESVAISTSHKPVMMPVATSPGPAMMMPYQGHPLPSRTIEPIAAPRVQQ